MRERYSIEVYENSVEIYGDLTIEETFDFLSFFERKGYKSVILGTENTTLHLLKRDQEQAIVDERVTNLKEEVGDYKEWLKKEIEDHSKTREKLTDVERLLKQLMSEEYQKYKELHDDNQKLIKATMIMQLQDNPEIQQILDKMKLSRPMTEEEKDGPFNQLLKMKNEECEDEKTQ
jgi:hypothetical protein